MTRRHIALIGFMAAGKTTIGKKLARVLGMPFVDSDAAVVAEHGEIDAIFSAHGEPHFRTLEYRALEGALQGEPSVIAVGGGAVTHGPSRKLLAEHATRVFIDAPPELSFARAREAKVARPMLGPVPSLETARALYEQRLPWYREAELTVQAGGRSAPVVAREIAAWVGARETSAP